MQTLTRQEVESEIHERMELRQLLISEQTELTVFRDVRWKREIAESRIRGNPSTEVGVGGIGVKIG